MENTNAQIVQAVIAYLLGVASGYMLRDVLCRHYENVKNKEHIFVLFIVTIIWAASVVADILSPAYDTNPLIHGLMGSIVGFYYYRSKQDENGKSK
jgi:formate-dependent nitrite reductase membrane component NrfD